MQTFCPWRIGMALARPSASCTRCVMRWKCAGDSCNYGIRRSGLRTTASVALRSRQWMHPSFLTSWRVCREPREVGALDALVLRQTVERSRAADVGGGGGLRPNTKARESPLRGTRKAGGRVVGVRETGDLKAFVSAGMRRRTARGSEGRLHSNGVAARKDPRGFGVFRVSPAGKFSSVILRILAWDGCAGVGECGTTCGEFCWAGCAFARRRPMAAWIFQRGASHIDALPVEGGLQ